MMRILLITNRYPAGPDDPASPFVPHFARALGDAGVTVDVLTPDYGTTDTVTGPVKVHRFTTDATVPIGSWNYLSPFAWLRLERFVVNALIKGRALCRSHRYDHVLALWALPSGHFAQQLSRQFNIPYSVWCLGSDIYSWAERPFFRGRIERVLRGAHSVFADGDDLCTRVNQWLEIDTHFMPSFRPLAGVDDVRPPESTAAPKYLYLGRLHQMKGVYELLEAFRIVRNSLPAATLTFVGGGPARRELTARVQAARLSDVVRLVGSVSNAEVVQYLIASDIVVIPSRSDSIPLVLTEAVQAYRPVIGTDIGDLGATIRGYGLGTVTQSLDPVVLAAAMAETARGPAIDPDGRRRLLDRMQPSEAVRTFLSLTGGEKMPSKTTRNSATPQKKPAYSE